MLAKISKNLFLYISDFLGIQQKNAMRLVCKKFLQYIEYDDENKKICRKIGVFVPVDRQLYCDYSDDYSFQQHIKDKNFALQCKYKNEYSVLCGQMMQCQQYFLKQSQASGVNLIIDVQTIQTKILQIARHPGMPILQLINQLYHPGQKCSFYQMERYVGFFYKIKQGQQQNQFCYADDEFIRIENHVISQKYSIFDYFLNFCEKDKENTIKLSNYDFDCCVFESENPMNIFYALYKILEVRTKFAKTYIRQQKNAHDILHEFNVLWKMSSWASVQLNQKIEYLLNILNASMYQTIPLGTRRFSIMGMVGKLWTKIIISDQELRKQLFDYFQAILNKRRLQNFFKSVKKDIPEQLIDKNLQHGFFDGEQCRIDEILRSFMSCIADLSIDAQNIPFIDHSNLSINHPYTQIEDQIEQDAMIFSEYFTNDFHNFLRFAKEDYDYLKNILLHRTVYRMKQRFFSFWTQQTFKKMMNFLHNTSFSIQNVYKIIKPQERSTIHETLFEQDKITDAKITAKYENLIKIHM